MNKLALLSLFFFSGLSLFAEETFDSLVMEKTENVVLGAESLSQTTTVYAIWVLNQKTHMEIQVPKKAFDALRVGDKVRITYEKGLFVNEIKRIVLIRSAPREEAGPSP